MLQPQVLEKVKPVGEVSLLVLMQGLSIIVPWQFTSLFTAWNCLSYTTRGAFLTKSNLNMYLLHHSADEVIQITSQELWDTIIKKTKGLRFTWLSISLKYNDLLFFFFFKQTQPVSCLGSKAKLTKVHQECQQILLTINHPHTSLTTNRELIMLIVGYLAAAPSINKCTKYSYSGCNTHTHTHTHGHLKLTMLWFLLRLLVTDKEQLFVLERLKSSINLSIFITSNTPKNNLPWLVGFFGKN